ncbi:gastrula zinc finger protein XlCGF66.1-like [Pelobates fuscus]|uniref:gastrula zinc finger protein XlCGF66.1-like n=1 Tax=Pelobates fuscus TaxID=191477 RepID=UPI002FE4DC6C
MNKYRNQVTERIINLTLEIIYLLTGEHYMVAKKHDEHVKQSSSPHVTDGSCRNKSPSMVSPPHSLIHERSNDKKILDLTNKIIELLTGEVPIRCEDVTVQFSVKEWEHFEGGEILCKKGEMETHQTFGSLDETETQNTQEARASPFSSQVHVIEDKMDIDINPDVTCMRIIKPKRKQRNTKEEMVSNEEKNITDPDTLTAHTECTSTDVKEEVDSCIKGKPSEMYVSTELTQTQYTSTQIKEEISGGGNLTETLAESTPTDNTSTDIKEESASGNKEKPIDMDIYKPTEYTSSHIKKEPILCEENARETDIYKPTEDTPIDYISTGIKEEVPSREAVNLTDIYSPPENTKTDDIPSHKNKKSFFRGRKNITYTNICSTPKQTQREYTSTYIDDELSLCKEGNLTDVIFRLPDYFQTEYSCTPLKKHQKCHRQVPEREKNFPIINSTAWGGNDTSSTSTSQHGRRTTERVYNCTECQKSFTSNADLVKHKAVHKGKKLTCSECGKIFSSKYNLLVHYRTHTGEKQFSCTECNKCFSVKSNLISHQRIHRGEKPFSCSECGRCFSAKSSLISHQKIHTGERPFICSVCGKCFSRRSHLTSHQNIHTREKNFPCSTCGSCFTAKSSLIKHQRIHTGEKPFTCSVCGKCFTQSSNLASHQRIHFVEKTSSHCTQEDLFSVSSGIAGHDVDHIDKQIAFY